MEVPRGVDSSDAEVDVVGAGDWVDLAEVG